jgi:hypothetical protein
MRYDIVEVINQIIKDGMRNSISHSTYTYNQDYSLCKNENGHFIISLKFFKFVTDADISKDQREVEIIRTVTFVDFEGFNSSFTDILINNKPISVKTDPKNYSLINLKNLIESIAAVDFEKYSEVNSTLTSLLTEIFRTSQNYSTFIFGFIDQNDNSILESTASLEILNKFKIMNTDYFFACLQEMNIDVSELDNKFLKEEFHVIEIIFSELLHYLEKSFLKKLNSKSSFDEEFFNDIKEMEQQEKYNYLKSWLEKKGFKFDVNPLLNGVFENVYNFLHSRAKWRCLYKARDDILKLSMNYKDNEGQSIVNTSRSRNAESARDREISVNETDELRVIYNSYK